MATTIGNLAAILTLDARKYTSGVKKADKDTRKFKKNLGGLTKTFKQIALAGAAFLGVRAVGGFLKESLRLFAEQERVTKQLGTALRIAGDNSHAAVPEMEAFASSMQKVTKFGDEAVIEISRLITSIGGLTGAKLREATKATLGLATSFGIEARAAAKILGKGARGEFGTLSEYGIQLDKTLSKQEKFNELLRLGNERFALAITEADTTAGSIQKLANAWGDFREALLKPTTPLLGPALTRIREGIEDFTEVLNLDRRVPASRRANTPSLVRLTELLDALGRSQEELNRLRSPFGVGLSASRLARQQHLEGQVPALRELISIQKKILAAEERKSQLNDPGTSTTVTGNDMLFFDTANIVRF